MLTVGEETLDRVVERADAGREPQLHRRAEGHLRVVDDGVGKEVRVAHATLGAGLVGEAGAGGELRHRQGCRYRNVRQSSQAQGDDLGRVDRAPAPEADDAVDTVLARVL